MKNKHHAMLYGFLAVALLFCAIWAVTASASESALENKIELSYAQRLSEAEEYLQSIPVKLDKALVSGGAASRAELLLSVSRDSDGVVTALGMLPLSHAALGDTMKYCNQLSEWSFTLAAGLMRGSEPTRDDLDALEKAASDCRLLSGQLATARMEMEKGGLRFTSEQSAFYGDAQPDARPLEQLSGGERGMSYPSMIYDGAFSDARHFGQPKALGEGEITAEEALAIAREYVGAERVSGVARASDTAGSIPCHGVAVTLIDGTALSVEVTKTGGKVLWMMPERASFGGGLTVAECEKAALDFLAKRGYGELEANHYQLYDGLAVINFVPVQDGALLYPDLVKLQVRTDTGEVVGVEANNYLMNHVARSGLSPALTKDEAQGRVSGSLEISASRLCLIPYLGGERLCYEFAGTYGDGEYRVYIDANTGEEAQILQIIQTESAILAA